MNVEVQVSKARKKMNVDRKRHPDFDARFKENYGIIWMWAIKLGKTFRMSKYELIGDLTLRLNQVLFSYEPSKGKFATYFGCGIAAEFACHRLLRMTEHFHAKANGKCAAHISGIGKKHGEDNFDVPERSSRDFGKNYAGDFTSRIAFWDHVHSNLTEREKVVIDGRFMLGKKQTEIAKEMGCSREWISQIESKAMAKLRECFLSVVDV